MESCWAQPLGRHYYKSCYDNNTSWEYRLDSVWLEIVSRCWVSYEQALTYASFQAFTTVLLTSPCLWRMATRRWMIDARHYRQPDCLILEDRNVHDHSVVPRLRESFYHWCGTKFQNFGDIRCLTHTHSDVHEYIYIYIHIYI